jgi:hypothetical protein
VADQFWSEAGSPMDKKEVLALRLEMYKWFDAEMGIKKSTASHELGRWMKNKGIK